MAALVIGVVSAAFVIGMRRKAPFVQDRVRRFARDVGNPRVLRTAGSAGSGASIVHHVGRSSGTAFETPVTAYPTPDGFVVNLPYGPGADWVRNVLAAGRADLTRDGERHHLSEVALVDTASIAHHLPAGERLTLKLFAVRDSLVFRR